MAGVTYQLTLIGLIMKWVDLNRRKMRAAEQWSGSPKESQNEYPLKNDHLAAVL